MKLENRNKLLTASLHGDEALVYMTIRTISYVLSFHKLINKWELEHSFEVHIQQLQIFSVFLVCVSMEPPALSFHICWPAFIK